MVDRNDDHSASSGDDVFGPLPSKITPEEQDEIDRVRKINEINGRQIGTKMHSTAVAREDWMLTPPEALRAGGMQSRKFSQKGVGNTQDNSDWTSAPGAERAANVSITNCRKES